MAQHFFDPDQRLALALAIHSQQRGWEDAELRDHSKLSRLLTHHCSPLAVRNAQDMRWKRFPGVPCEHGDGRVACAASGWAQFNDVDSGEKDSERRMAERRCEFWLPVGSASGGSGARSGCPVL